MCVCVLLHRQVCSEYENTYAHAHFYSQVHTRKHTLTYMLVSALKCVVFFLFYSFAHYNYRFQKIYSGSYKYACYNYYYTKGSILIRVSIPFRNINGHNTACFLLTQSHNLDGINSAHN